MRGGRRNAADPVLDNFETVFGSKNKHRYTRLSLKQRRLHCLQIVHHSSSMHHAPWSIAHAPLSIAVVATAITMTLHVDDHGTCFFL